MAQVNYKKYYFSKILILLLFVFVFSVFWQAEDVSAINTCATGWQVTANGGEKEINCHGVCKIVKNNGSASIFVPTYSDNEWLQFRSNNPENVELSDCTNTLTVTKSGTGSGTVTSNPSGINCGSTCSASYICGTSVTLTATAASGSTFAGWSGGGCSGTGSCNVTVDNDKTVTATFNLAGGGDPDPDPEPEPGEIKCYHDSDCTYENCVWGGAVCKRYGTLWYQYCKYPGTTDSACANTSESNSYDCDRGNRDGIVCTNNYDILWTCITHSMCSGCDSGKCTIWTEGYLVCKNGSCNDYIIEKTTFMECCD